jgi:hypothetical protein
VRTWRITQTGTARAVLPALHLPRPTSYNTITQNSSAFIDTGLLCCGRDTRAISNTGDSLATSCEKSLFALTVRSRQPQRQLPNIEFSNYIGHHTDSPIRPFTFYPSAGSESAR